MPAEPYKIGEKYRVTMVRGWWLQELHDKPEWFPVMGTLHEDKAVFGLGAFHYHVDPRFLDERLDKRVEADRERDERFGAISGNWHPSYRRVMTNFPAREQAHYIGIDDRNAYVREKAYGTIVTVHPRQWGVKRIATRSSQLLCRRKLPNADVNQYIGKKFRKLREAYGEPSGDRCPHRGYDLRSVPIDPDGCRQCPLHQLRVRAPHVARKSARTARAVGSG